MIFPFFLLWTGIQSLDSLWCLLAFQNSVNIALINQCSLPKMLEITFLRNTACRSTPLNPLNGAKCNLSKVKLETMQSVDSPLAVHDQQGCPRDFAGLAFDSCCIDLHWVILEKIHTPPTDGTPEILEGGGVEGSGNPGRRGGLDLKSLLRGSFSTITLSSICNKSTKIHSSLTEQQNSGDQFCQISGITQCRSMQHESKASPAKSLGQPCRLRL